MLDESEYYDKDWKHAARRVMSPPFRDKVHQDDLWNGLRAGSLQVVATDHCAFTTKQKELGLGDFTKIPNGTGGLEDRMPVLWTYGVETGRLTMNEFVAVTSTNIARILNVYPRKGAILPGADADIAVWDPKANKTISARSQLSVIDYNVFEGTKVTGLPRYTLSRGEVVFRDGTVQAELGRGRFIRREPFAADARALKRYKEYTAVAGVARYKDGSSMGVAAAPSLISDDGGKAPRRGGGDRDQRGFAALRNQRRPGAGAQQRDLKVGRGEFVSFIGPSGCGKTTLLRAVADLETPTSGAIRVNGMSPREARAKRAYGYVFQAPALYPWRSVARNIALPLEIMGFDKAEREARVAKGLELVNLSGFGNKYPWQLSGGMQQRASIARALSFDPDLLLMDEPFGALDEIVRDMLNQQLLRLWDVTGKTVLFVTHSIPEAVFLSTHIVVMSPRPGRINDVIECNFPRDRALDIRETPEFMAVANRVRHGLREGHSYDG